MSKQYDVVVIGAGSGGLTAAVVNGELGRKVALVEREHIGGDCTWSGCMPSKALLHVAKIAHAARIADQYGIVTSEPVVNMAAVRDYVQGVIQSVYAHETPEMVTARGVEFVQGSASFIDSYTIKVADRTLRAMKFIIATGGRPAIPPIPGLDTVDYFTNRNFFDNARLPDHLLVMGAGPIGMEMAQAYRRLGACVTVIGDQIMPRDEPEAVTALKQVFEREGIGIIQALVTGVSRAGDRTLNLRLNNDQTISGDMLLVAVGRAPNVEIGLDKAGVIFTQHGIPVNEKLQTNIPHIYAIGDVTTGAKFTHYAGFQGAVAGRNLFLPLGKSDGLVEHLPWVTFTDPEVAHAGMTEARATEQYGDSVKTYTFDLSHGDRSVAEDDTDGFIKLVYRGRGELLGATIVAARAGEMIIEYQLLIERKLKNRDLAGIIHAYPTYSDITKQALSKMLIKELSQSRLGVLARQIISRLP